VGRGLRRRGTLLDSEPRFLASLDRSRTRSSRARRPCSARRPRGSSCTSTRGTSRAARATASDYAACNRVRSGAHTASGVLRLRARGLGARGRTAALASVAGRRVRGARRGRGEEVGAVDDEGAPLAEGPCGARRRGAPPRAGRLAEAAADPLTQLYLGRARASSTSSGTRRSPRSRSTASATWPGSDRRCREVAHRLPAEGSLHQAHRGRLPPHDGPDDRRGARRAREGLRRLRAALLDREKDASWSLRVTQIVSALDEAAKKADATKKK